MGELDHGVHLTVPAHAEYVDVIRTVVGRQAHRLGFSFDGIEDVCLAVDEATVLLLSLAPRADRIEVAAALVDSSIEVLLGVSVGEAVTWPPRSLDDDVRWQVLRALADEVRLSEGDQPTILVRQRAR
jgi:hypothetical protein